MKCPHCTVNIHENWDELWVNRGGRATDWAYRTAHCPACNEITVQAAYKIYNQVIGDYVIEEWIQIHPRGSNRGPVPPQVPENIRGDYEEACLVLPLSAKASAALSRRCLQNILRAQGYRARDLAAEIDLVLNETDMTKAISPTLRMAIDAIRNFGNFSAHPITDVTTLQIIDVEAHEAEWCLEVLEAAFQHYYVAPAEAAARKAALDAKLQAAGKPASK